jgi:hypothetical protein
MYARVKTDSDTAPDGAMTLKVRQGFSCCLPFNDSGESGETEQRAGAEPVGLPLPGAAVPHQR